MQQTVWSGIRAILHHSGMKNGFWAEALAVIVHVMNRAPRKHLDWRTPHEVLTGQVPNMAYVCTFGCRAWVHNHKGKKLDAKALPMVFVGYEPGSKAYRLLDSANHKVVVSSDVTFDETLFPNRPVDKPVTPPTTDKGLNVPNVRSEGKQVTFTELPLLVFEPGDDEPPKRYIPPHWRHTLGSAGSSPGTSSQIPQPASQEQPPSSPPHSPSSPRPVWKKVFTDSDDETDEVEMLIGDDLPEAPFPPRNDNLSAEVTKHTPPPATPHPTSPVQPIPLVITPPYAPTPASVVFSLPSSLNSPNPESLHSDSEFIEENLQPRRSERKKKKTTKYSGADANIIASDEDMRKLDKAYNEGVKLFISAATSNREPSAN